MTLSQILGGSSAGLVLLLTLIEIAPIKVNPWSALFSAIGRRINKEVLDEITELKKNMSMMSGMQKNAAHASFTSGTSCTMTRGTRRSTSIRSWTTSMNTASIANLTRTSKTTRLS